MKYLAAMAIVSLWLYGLTSAGAKAGDEPTQVIEHHNSQHSLGPCGLHPCPEKQKAVKAPKKKRK